MGTFGILMWIASIPKEKNNMVLKWPRNTVCVVVVVEITKESVKMKGVIRILIQYYYIKDTIKDMI